MRRKLQTTVLSQKELAAGIYDLRLAAPEIAAEARAGQFVNVYCSDKSRLLPRPISLAGIEKGSGAIRLVYRVSGEGTGEFSRLRAGDAVEVLGPLGNGFPVQEVSGSPGGSFPVQTVSEVFLIGGGIGIPPLLETAKELKKAAADTENKFTEDRFFLTAVLGYRDGDTFLREEFDAVCGRVLIATEDGSKGVKGTVLDAMHAAHVLPGAVQTEDFMGRAGSGQGKPVWFVCGPTPMLRALKAAAGENEILCWLSLEERMACGVGACLACVCKTAEKDGHSQVNNRRVCKDGPVFRAEEIIL